MDQTASVPFRPSKSEEIPSRAEIDRRKDDFLAFLGHELRNPIAAITMAAESLRHLGSSNKDIVAMVEIIVRQSAHAARLLDDLLDVSRISHGKIQLRKERLDLVETIRSLIADRFPSASEPRFDFATDFPTQPVWVEADPTRITQVVGNILANAVKFSDPPGPIAVALQSDAARNEAILEISDTGVGIDPAKLANIFEPFRQAKRDFDRNREGLGLGLALAKGLIEMHGGRVWAESEGPGRGASVYAALPLAADMEQSKRAPNAPTSGSRRVLLIDDSPDVVQSLQFLFSMWGHELLVAYHGQQGLDIARREQPEVILCDIGLPGMSGYDVARTLRATPETSGAYLIAVSGFGTAEDKQRARDAGFDIHLNKPEGFTTLDRLLRDLPSRA